VRETETGRARTRVRAREAAREGERGRGDVWCGIGADEVVGEQVLNKEPKGRDVDDRDVFHFNSKLDVKPLRIKINSIQLKETQEENDKTTEVQDHLTSPKA